MRRRCALIVLTVAIVGLAVMLWSALGSASPAHAAQALSSLAASISTLAVDPTPTATEQASSSSSGGLDPAVVAALIGMVVAFVAGGFAIFQTIYSAKVQQEIAAMQQRHEQEMEGIVNLVT